MIPTTPLSIWTLSDGRAGIDNQALGLAEAIVRQATARHTPAEITPHTVNLTPGWRRLPIRWPFDPWRHICGRNRLLQPPQLAPSILIGCGRQSLYFTSRWKRRWPATTVIQIQDPKLPLDRFDLVVPPFHDDLRGPNVVPLVGAPNRITPERLHAEAQTFSHLGEAPRPRLAVLIGGANKHQTLSPERARRLCQHLRAIQAEGVTIWVTTSRRTPVAAKAVFDDHLKPHVDLYYDGEGQNPYFALLALADTVMVTSDSVNMASEAATAGRPVLVFEMDGQLAAKFARFHLSLQVRGNARPFEGKYESWSPPPFAETDRVATEILDRITAQQTTQETTSAPL